MAEVCGAWRHALQQHRPPEIPAAPNESSTNALDAAGLPALAEMDRVIELLPLAVRGENLPDELKLPPHQKSGLLVPDAFTNPEHIHFAIKGMIAATICYLIFTLCAYPNIYTSVITVIVCSLASVILAGHPAPARVHLFPTDPTHQARS